MDSNGNIEGVYFTDTRGLTFYKNILDQITNDSLLDNTYHRTSNYPVTRLYTTISSDWIVNTRRRISAGGLITVQPSDLLKGMWSMHKEYLIGRCNALELRGVKSPTGDCVFYIPGRDDMDVTMRQFVQSFDNLLPYEVLEVFLSAFTILKGWSVYPDMYGKIVRHNKDGSSINSRYYFKVYPDTTRVIDIASKQIRTEKIATRPSELNGNVELFEKWVDTVGTVPSTLTVDEYPMLDIKNTLAADLEGYLTYNAFSKNKVEIKLVERFSEDKIRRHYADCTLVKFTIE